MNCYERFWGLELFKKAICSRLPLACQSGQKQTIAAFHLPQKFQLNLGMMADFTYLAASLKTSSICIWLFSETMLTTVSIQLNETGLYPDTVPTYLHIVVEQEAGLCVGLDYRGTK